MSGYYIAEIKMFAGNFAPTGFALCNGQLMSIQQNTALFSLLGTQFGGDGIQTFGLPDLRGRVPVNQGQGPGLSPYVIGELGGVEQVTLSQAEIPLHTHVTTLQASSAAGNATAPTAATVLAASTTRDRFYSTNPPDTTVSANSSAVGSNLPHSNVQPFLAVTFIIALIGIFPSRN